LARESKPFKTKVDIERRKAKRGGGLPFGKKKPHNQGQMTSNWGEGGGAPTQSENLGVEKPKKGAEVWMKRSEPCEKGEVKDGREGGTKGATSDWGPRT